MPTNTKLGGVFTTDLDNNIGGTVNVSTENVCGIIFDTKIVGGLATALGTGTTAATKFANGAVVELNTSKDVESAGIDATVMSGLPLHHLSNFFTLAGENQRIFVSFMDSTTDTNFEAVEKMVLAANGIIYQIGVWTGEALCKKTDSTVTIVDGGILSKLQAQAEVVGGKIGHVNYDGNAPINILVNAPIVTDATFDVASLPDMSSLNLPKVSVILGQPATDAVHTIQAALGGMCPVGNVGAALACLAVAPADISIGWVKEFNLSSVMTNAELGFGNLDIDTTSKAFKADAAFTNIKTLGYSARNTIHSKGYIFLTNLDGIENGVFFSSDQTLSTGDYRTLMRCRVMHKSRRSVRKALLPFVNQSVEVDSTTGQLSSSMITTYQNAVLAALDDNMVEPGTSVPQISGRTCTISSTQDILTNDELQISYSLVPVGCTSVIMVTEGFVTSVS
jgi:hypothetical protein